MMYHSKWRMLNDIFDQIEFDVVCEVALHKLIITILVNHFSAQIITNLLQWILNELFCFIFNELTFQQRFSQIESNAKRRSISCHQVQLNGGVLPVLLASKAIIMAPPVPLQFRCHCIWMADFAHELWPFSFYFINSSKIFY